MPRIRSGGRRARVALIAFVGALLVLPTLSTSASTRYAVQLTTSAGTVLVNHPQSLTGSVSPAARVATMRLERYTSSRWHTLASTILTRSSTATRPAAVVVGHASVVTGAVSPDAAGGTVWLQQVLDGAWHALASTSLDGSSHYRFSVPQTRTGSFGWRVPTGHGPGRCGREPDRRGRRRAATGPGHHCVAAGRLRRPGVRRPARDHGGEGTRSWSATGLPAGLTLSGDGELSGTPAAVGSSSPTVTVSTLCDTASATLTLDVPESAPAVATTSLPDAWIGTPYDTTLDTADHRNGTWSVTGGTLPSGITPWTPAPAP